MNLLYFRHAHRNSNELDPPLSSQGGLQAQAIVDAVKKKELPCPDVLLCSPKRRAQETFAPLKLQQGILMITETALDERQNSESGKQFENRIHDFMKNRIPYFVNKNVFVVTHFDWLEKIGHFLNIEGGEAHEKTFSFSPAAYLWLTSREGHDFKSWNLKKTGRF